MVETDGVPSFVRKCVEQIEVKGIMIEGIYRVSGKREDCLTLQEKYDQGIYVWLVFFFMPYTIICGGTSNESL